MVRLLADMPSVPPPPCRPLFCLLCLRPAVVVRDDDVLEPAHLGDAARCPDGHTPDTPGWDEAFAAFTNPWQPHFIDGEGLGLVDRSAAEPVTCVVPWMPGTRFGCVVRDGSGGMGARMPARLRHPRGWRA